MCTVPAVGPLRPAACVLDRDAAPAQGVGEHAPRGGTRSAAAPPRWPSVRRNAPEPGRAGWPSRRSIATSSSTVTCVVVEQLVRRTDRWSSWPEVGGEVERQARPTTPRRCRRRGRGGRRRRSPWSGGSARPARRRGGRRGGTEKWSARRVGHAAEPGERARRRSGDEPGRVGRATARRNAARACAGADAATNTPLCRRRSTPASTSRSIVVLRPTPCVVQRGGGDDAVVVGEPRDGGRGEVGHRTPPRRVRRGGCRCASTVRAGCAHRSVGAAGDPPAHTPDDGKHSDGRSGVAVAAVAGLRRGRRGRRGTGRWRWPTGRRGPSCARRAPAATPEMPLLSLGSYCDGGDDEEDAGDRRTRPSGRRSRCGRAPRSAASTVADGGAIRFMNDACTAWWYTWYTATPISTSPTMTTSQPPGRQVEQRRRRLLLLLVAGVLTPPVDDVGAAAVPVVDRDLDRGDRQRAVDHRLAEVLRPGPWPRRPRPGRRRTPGSAATRISADQPERSAATSRTLPNGCSATVSNGARSG